MLLSQCPGLLEVRRVHSVPMWTHVVGQFSGLGLSLGLASAWPCTLVPSVAFLYAHETLMALITPQWEVLAP